MRSMKVFSYAPALTLLLALAARADEPCAQYKWDLSKERALFTTAGATAAAAKDGASAAAAAPNRLYRVQLLPASQVSFPARPAKSSTADDTYAGVLGLTVPASGQYRMAIDQPLWVDIVADGKLIPASDYEGEHGCDAPRKVVVFALDAKQHLLLQLSASSQAAVRLAITQVPAG